MWAPMARDLRMIAAVIHIVTDLERMADHAAGTAKIAIQTADQAPLKPLVDIPRMSEIARSMLHDAITAFIEDDQAAARAIVARDDEVDALYEQVYRELLTFMLADPTTIDQATHLLWAAHNLERIADRVTNICERVVFAATGQLEELAVSTY
jgi:phosphate transport system protein